VQLDGPHRLRLAEVPVAEPGAGEVRVQVSHAGICGSDLHVCETGAYVPCFPVIPGHEVSGRVEALGPEVQDLAPGDGVVLDSRVPCRACDWCAHGEFGRCRRLGFLGEMCNGGFARSVVAPRAAVFAVPVGLPLRVAALAEPCAVALHGIRRALAVVPDAHTALVVGVGPLGALVGLVLAQQGLDVAGVETDSRRREVVARVAGFPVLDPATASSERPRDLVVNTAGLAGSLAACMERARVGGTVLALALHRGPETLSANGLVEGELTLLGSHVFRDEMPAALELLSQHPDTFGALITAEVPLDGVERAYQELLAGGSGQIKVMVTPT
jgi:(R,R)-butanediol dehydrogenase/meso-butanediol dehydrogenase/diacetyl reductase